MHGFLLLISVFLNKASILKTLSDIPDNTSVVLDASANLFMHHDVIEIIEDLQISAPARKTKVKVIGLYKNKVKEPLKHYSITN